jgi:hypothetical protein
MNDATTALANWEKSGTDYDRTFYKRVNDKHGTELYAHISGPSVIEQYLPSAESQHNLFIRKADIPFLTGDSV